MSLKDYSDIQCKLKDGVVVRGTGLNAAKCTYLLQLLGGDKCTLFCYKE